MQIVLGGYTFPEEGIAFSEERGDVAGRNRRRIQITGLFSGLSSMDAVEALLDEVLAASVAGEAETTLSIRPGRELIVRRTGFWRDLNHQALAGSFKLDLEAVSPYESASTPTVIPWTVSTEFPAAATTNEGTKWAPPHLVYTTDSIQPGLSISDGTRTLLFDGDLHAGETITFDALAGKIYVEGTDATAKAVGEFPRIAPGVAALVLASPSPVALAGEAVLTFRERWW